MKAAGSSPKKPVVRRVRQKGVGRNLDRYLDPVCWSKWSKCPSAKPNYLVQNNISPSLLVQVVQVMVLDHLDQGSLEAGPSATWTCHH